jgi:hypothetical protein
MKKIDPLFLYLSVLAVIQPARVQDVEDSAASLLPPDTAKDLLAGGLLRIAHDKAKELGIIIPLRKGVYVIANSARGIVRKSGLEREIDNRRLFLMKEQRRRYK